MLTLALLLCTAQDPITLEPETGPAVTFKDNYDGAKAVADRPARIKSTPKGVVRWFSFPWGDGTAVIGASAKQLWADTNGDGDLDDEKPVAYATGYDGKAATVVMKLKLVNRTIDATLQFRFYEATEMRVTNLTRMSGKVTVGGREMAVSLCDYLVNGRYDDYRTTATKEYWLCDHVHLDVDGDGKFKNSIPPRGEDFSLAHAFVIGDAVYGFEVVDHGEKLKFTKRDTKLVTVKANVPEYSIALVSDDYGCPTLDGKDGLSKIPAGTYRWDYYTYKVKDDRVSGYFHRDDPVRTLEIKEGLEITLRAPLKYEIFDERVRGALVLWTIAYGPNGERVEIWPGKGGTNLEPTLRILTEKGAELWSKESHYC